MAADVCIVGAGVAGLTLAGELAGAGLDVLLLEAGDVHPDEGTQALHDIDSIGYPVRENFMSRARHLGGSCNLWAGRCMRLSPADVAGRDWVEDTGWPIEYPELEAFYPGAADILGLPPVDRFDPSAYNDMLSDAERRLFAADDLEATVSLWAPRPWRFGAARRRALGRSRHVQIVLNANCTRIELTPDGRAVAAVHAATLSGNRLRVRARVHVLAGGGMENARLMLAPDEGRDTGVGNRHDFVGRYFMDHPRAIFGSVRLQSGRALPLLGGRPLVDGKAQLGIGLAEEARRRDRLLNHYVTFEATHSEYAAQTYESVIQLMKVVLRRGYAGSRLDIGRSGLSRVPGLIYLLTPRELLPHRLYRWYVQARDALRPAGGPVERTVVYFCEQPPSRESRLTLTRERDALGVPRLALDWQPGDEVERTVLRLQEILAARLRDTGTGELTPGEGRPVFTDASHHMGTTRMSSDPRLGVVDPHCRVHDVGNLYVAGSSVFPSAGHANPTLTMIALVLRLADHLREHPDLAR